MKRFLVLFVVACGSAPQKPAPAPKTVAPIVKESDALAAYEAKQWAKCAELYEAFAEGAKGRDRENAIYNAACCHAQAGKPDNAFALLERAVAAGLRTGLEHMKKDPDLVALHADARWAAVIAGIEKNVAAWETSLGAPELRREILELVAEDQKARFAYIAKQDDESLKNAMTAIDAKTTARMKEVIAKHGWPGKKLVGDDGANGAWLLVQHADKDVAFQKQCLALIEKAVAAGDVEPRNYAYLYDRVAVAEQRPQRYGTQFKDGEPQPIEDEANVDARRKAVGLDTMAEYRKQMAAMYGPQKK